jgi:hypothetical protein
MARVHIRINAAELMPLWENGKKRAGGKGEHGHYPAVSGTGAWQFESRSRMRAFRENQWLSLCG